jgi:hypothetical protein
MKAIVILLGLIGLGVGGMYYFGGYSSFDPDKQGRDAKAAIKPGMTLAQVVAVAGENPKLHTISMYTRKVGGQTFKERKVGPAVTFVQSRVAKGVKDGIYTNGFILSYMFSQQVAFDVLFDNTGLVVELEDAATIADLLDSRQK